jgi:hypothetical protein
LSTAANADQTDADNNGLGDACDELVAGIAVAAEAGVKEAVLDDRLRPVSVAGDGLVARFTWSDDSTTATIQVDGNGASSEIALSADFSDAAILAGLDDTEADSGGDPAALRPYVMDNPGRIQALVTGTLPAARTVSRSAFHAPAGKPWPVTYTNIRGRTHTFLLGPLMLHVCNHGSHHRAQAVNMLCHVGGEVPELDVPVMLSAKK